jgi:hypothetical protein
VPFLQMTSSQYHVVLPKGSLECVSLLYHIVREPGSCVGSEIGCPDFYSFPQALQAIFGVLGST